MTPELDKLISDHRALAIRLARRYSKQGWLDPDLEQVAMLGLVLAAQRYSPDSGPFAPFAVATVSGELKKHLRNTGWAVHVTRSVQEQSIAVERTASELAQSLGRSATPAEIGAHLGLSVEQVITAIRARDVRFAGELPALDTTLSPSGFEITDRIALQDALSILEPEQRELLRLRYSEELTQRELAERLETSQTQIHRRLTTIFSQLRSALERSGYEQ